MNTMSISRLLRAGFLITTLYAATGLQYLAAQLSDGVTENWRISDFAYNGKMLETDIAGNSYVVADSPATYNLNIRKYSADGTLDWERTYDDSTYNLIGVWEAIDIGQNLVVVANIVRSTDGQPLGWMTLKYDSNGNLLWTRPTPRASTSNVARVAVDTLGNIYVAGTGVLTKYSPTGIQLWQDSSGEAGQPFSMAVIQDTSTGKFRIGVAGKNGITGLNFRVVMYDSDGNHLWTNTTAGVYPANDIVFDGDFSAHIATGTYLPLDPNPYQMAIVKLDAAGNLAWSHNYAEGDSAYRIALTVSGIVATGVDANGYLDWMTIKTDRNGNLLWSRRYDGTNNNDETPSMLKTGLFGGDIYITGKGGPSPSSGIISNIKGVVVKYGQDGSPKWAQWDDYAGGKAITLSSVDSMGGPISPVYSLGWGYFTLAQYTDTGLLDTSPVAPSNLTISGTTLTFADNASNEFWVEIERCAGADCNNFVKIGQTRGENATTYTDSTAASGTTYNYRARALGFMGGSAYSNTATLVTTPSNPPAAAPSNLSTQAISKSQINLGWTNNSPNQSGVKIERCTGSSCKNFALIATVSGTANTFTNTGLASRTSYRYRIKAYNSAGDSPYSNISSTTTLRK